MGSNAGIPSRLPAVITDKILICLRAAGEMILHAELEFSQRLDADRLARAFSLALDAEPVLGCRFVTSPLRVFWERLVAGERENFRVACDAAGYERFRTEPHEAESRPQLAGCLWSDGDRDRLMIKLRHEVGDAGGLKETMALVASIYTRLGSEPDYRPVPNLGGSRGVEQAFRGVPWWAPARIYGSYLAAQWRLLRPGRGLRMPWQAGRSGDPFLVVRHLEPGRVADLARWGRARGATLNDIVLGAALRALARAAGRLDEPVQLMFTADLRRQYLASGRAEGICNLSGLEFIALRGDLGDRAATIDAVSRFTRARKASFIGLCDYVGGLPLLSLLPARWIARAFAGVLRVGLRRSSFLNALTNMGPITAAATTFDRPAERAWLVVPPIFPPRFGIGLSGYAGSLTLTSGSWQPGAEPGAIESFFDLLHAELPG